MQGRHPGSGGLHIVRPEPLIDGQAPVQRVERGGRDRAEPAAPHGVWRAATRCSPSRLETAGRHPTSANARRAATRAPMVIGKPKSLMKPAASACR